MTGSNIILTQLLDGYFPVCIKSRPDLVNFLCVGTWRYKGSPLPFVDHKVALAGDDPGQVLRGGVDVGEDGDEGDDETEDPSRKNQGNHNISAEKVREKKV